MKNRIASSYLAQEEQGKLHLSSLGYLHAFEIKHSSQVNSKSLKGLKQFQQDYPEAKTTLVYLGKSREYHGGIEVIPFGDLLLELPEFLRKL